MAGRKIENYCENILSSVRSSNLNYSCQETPFSIYLTIRKSWSKQTKYSVNQLSEPVLTTTNKLLDSEVKSLRDEVISLKVELAEVKADVWSAAWANLSGTDKLSLGYTTTERRGLGGGQSGMN